MGGKPDMIWQFSQKLKREYEQMGLTKVEIFARSRVRLNKSKRLPIVDENQDLASTKWEPFRHASWIP